MAGQARKIFKEWHQITHKLFNDSSVKSCEGKGTLCEFRYLRKNDVNHS